MIRVAVVLLCALVSVCQPFALSAADGGDDGIPPGVPDDVREMILRVRKLDEKSAYKELIRAIRSGNKQRLKVILFVFPKFFNKPDVFGRTPLFNAVFASKPEIVKYLLSKGANVLKSDVDDNSPLHRAAANGDVEIMKMLAAKGANVYAMNKKGRTPLFAAALHGELKAIAFLLSQQASVNRCDKNGDTPLHLAAFVGDVNTVKFLLAHGADKSIKNKKGKTPADVAEKSLKGLLR